MVRRVGATLAAVAVAAAIAVVTTSAQQGRGGGGQPFAPGELLVKYRPSASTSSRNAILAGQGASLVRRFRTLDSDLVRLPPGRSVAAAVAAFRAVPDVLLAQPNYIRRAVASAPPNDPYWLFGFQWNLEQIQAQAAWTSFTTGDPNVVVASLDTGVNYTHPDLAPNMWHNPGEIPGNGIDDDGNGYVDDVYGIDTVNHDSDPMDDNGHGTHTAGIIGANGNDGVGVVGVNWRTSILACKFINASGYGTDADAVECFDYLVSLRQRGINVRVTNNSWGASREGSPATVLQDAIDAAGAAGILNVFAAGNDGTNNDLSPFDPAISTRPASSRSPRRMRPTIGRVSATTASIRWISRLLATRF